MSELHNGGQINSALPDLFSCRSLLSLCVLCAFASLLFTLSTFAAAKQPNIVFIFSDDHAYQAISAYNDPRKLLQTPNLDRIAKEGMLFARAMVPNSICGPSRATVLTGKYNHLNGFYNNSNKIGRAHV